MKELHVGTSPLTNRIYAGHLKMDGRVWSDGKQDVTGKVCGAVVEHVLANKGPVVVNVNGEAAFEISVRKL